MTERPIVHRPEGAVARFGEATFPGDPQLNAIAQSVADIRGQLNDFREHNSAIGEEDFRRRPVRGSIIVVFAVIVAAFASAVFGAGVWLFSRINDSEKEIAALRTTVAVLEERLKQQSARDSVVPMRVEPPSQPPAAKRAR